MPDLKIGIVLFPITYLMLTGITSLYLDVPGTILYALSLPFSGLFVLVYHERIIRKLPLWQSVVLRNYRSHLKRLAGERALFIRDLDAVKARTHFQINSARQ